MKNHLKLRMTIILAVLVSMFLSTPGIAFAAQNGDSVILKIMELNDFHGAMADKGPGKNPGVAKLTAFLKAEKAKDRAGTLLFAAGDMFQGSVDSNLTYGKSMIEIMNYVGFDAMALGNHEFDWGIDTLLNMKKQAAFPLGGANVFINGGVAPFARPSLFSPAGYMFVKRENVTIGIIPLTTPETAFKANPKVVGAYTFADPAQVVRDIVPKLRARGAQVIIVLSHLGSTQDPTTGKITGEAADLANALPAGMVDAIISAHTHMAVKGYVNSIPVIQAKNNGDFVGEIQLAYSKSQQKVVSSTLNLINLAALNSSLTPDPYAKAILDKYSSINAATKNQLLGSTKSALTHIRFGSNESVLGEWTTDVMRNAVGADFAFQNDGGLRTSINAGPITLGNVYEVMPFDNTLNTMTMTGAQIVQVLEYGIRNSKIGILQFSGANVVYDSSRPSGSRVVSVTMLNGTPLNNTKNYKVVTNDFMASGGDNYTMFKQATNVKETGVLVRDTIADAIKKAGIITFNYDNRLVVR